MDVKDFKIKKELLANSKFYDIEFTINNLHKFGSTLPVEFFNDYLLTKLYEMIKLESKKEVQIDFDESIGFVYLKKCGSNLIFYIRSDRTYGGYEMNESSDMIIFFSYNENVKEGITNFLIENEFIHFTPNKRRKLE